VAVNSDTHVQVIFTTVAVTMGICTSKKYTFHVQFERCQSKKFQAIWISDDVTNI